MVETKIYVPEEMLPWIENEKFVSMVDRNAMMFYPYIKRQVISHGKAAQILGIRKNELIEIYGKYGIPYYDYDENELDKEVANYQEIRNKESAAKRYEESLSKAGSVIRVAQLPMVKMDLAGLSRYAREKGVSVQTLADEEKAQFGVYVNAETSEK